MNIFWEIINSFLYNDSTTTKISTLSLHDALPICFVVMMRAAGIPARVVGGYLGGERSEEHTSELQSRGHLVCRLLLEEKRGSVDFEYRGVAYHVWEFQDNGTWGAESSVKTVGRDE